MSDRCRILKADVDEILAMQTHLQEQIDHWVGKHKEMSHKKVELETKIRQLMQQKKESASQNKIIELGLLSAEMNEITLKVKDLQRQTYFMIQELRRKKLLLKKSEDDLVAEKNKNDTSRKFMKAIKEMVCFTYLNSKCCLIVFLGCCRSFEDDEQSEFKFFGCCKSTIIY